MSLVKLSLMNLKQNLKNYGTYIFSMMFSVIVFYNFLSLIMSEQFSMLKDMNTVVVITSLCSIVLVMFFIFLISYSSKFFIERRKKEFGIYTFMGIENNKIAMIFAGEGLLIGIISLVSGILGGIVLNKLFLMAIFKVAKLESLVKFEVPMLAIILTCVIFVGILIVVFAKEYLVLVKTDITKLINASNMYQERVTKNSILKGFLGFFMILLAYLLIIKFYKTLGISFQIAIAMTVLMIIAGTLLLFQGFFIFFIDKIIKNKKHLYKGVNIISYNNIIFRIKDNHKTLAQVAILITCALTSITASVSMRTIFTSSKDVEIPYSTYYITRTEEDEKIANRGIDLSNQEVDYRFEVKMLPYKLQMNEFMNDPKIVKYSDIKNILDKKDIENKERIIKNAPSKGEGIIIIPKNLINAFDLTKDLNIADKKITINDGFAATLFGTIVYNPVLIVSDGDYSYFEKKIDGAQASIFHGVVLKEFEATSDISNYIIKNSDIPVYGADMFDDSRYDFINVIYFIGLFLALVFMVSVGSIMHFKCISDASKDKPRFDVLRKIGVSQKNINMAIAKQVGIYFSLPMAVGGIHSIVAGYAVSDMFNHSPYKIISVSLGSFVLIYAIYYLLTVKKYVKLTK